MLMTANSVLTKYLVDVYMSLLNSKELWGALETTFGVSDAGSELYVMEQLYDYKVIDNRSVVEQAHEIQTLAYET